MYAIIPSRRRNMKYLVKSITAGILIGIGGTAYLMASDKVVGAILFGIGLFVIVVQELNLFTGRIGYVVSNKINYLIEVGITLIGNLIGTVGIALLLLNTRISSAIVTKASGIVDSKLNDNLLSIFILAIFCGILMYIAVNGYKTIKDSVGKYLVVFLCVTVFILSSYEHCIANMYYFTIAGAWNLNTIIYLLVMILGNSVGAIGYALVTKYLNKQKECA
jgi:formate/nitrite transporter FocA (FNT family)